MEMKKKSGHQQDPSAQNAGDSTDTNDENKTIVRSEFSLKMYIFIMFVYLWPHLEQICILQRLAMLRNLITLTARVTLACVVNCVFRRWKYNLLFSV